MIIRDKVIRLKKYGVTHRVRFDIQIDRDGVNVFNLRPNYHPEDGEDFYFNQDIVENYILDNPCK